MSTAHDLKRFFTTNSAWAEAVTAKQPGFFKTLAAKQTPKILWFGCADSRVPESVVLAVKPGEVFVHRNIANQFHLDDDSALSVLAFAIEALEIQRVVVVGHTKCGGIKGAFDIASAPGDKAEAGNTPLGRWLTPLVNLAKSHDIPAQGEEHGIPKLTVESVKRQVANIASTSVVKNAWAEGKPVSIHGWIYHLENGRLEDLGIDVYPSGGTPEAADE